MSDWEIVGRTVAITGASGGIGRATALALAGFGANLILLGRDPSKHEPVLGLIANTGAKATFVETDLADLSTVARAGQLLRELDSPLTVLINNAGVAGIRGRTVDGFELAFAVNHLAHFLLTRMVLDSMIAHAPSRVLTLSSEAHRRVGAINWEHVTGPTKSLTGAAEYSRSKAANIAFTVELNKRLNGFDTKAVAIHPGLAATGIWRRIPPPLQGLVTRRMITPELGGAVVANCAIIVDLAAGGYYTPAGLGSASRFATDPSTAREVWEKSEEMVAQWL